MVTLPSSVWKQRACEMVEQWSLVSLISESEPVKAIKCKEILPHVRDSVIGDGHCLFRAISKEITGRSRLNLEAVLRVQTNNLVSAVLLCTVALTIEIVL